MVFPRSIDMFTRSIAQHAHTKLHIGNTHTHIILHVHTRTQAHTYIPAHTAQIPMRTHTHCTNPHNTHIHTYKYRHTHTHNTAIHTPAQSCNTHFRSLGIDVLTMNQTFAHSIMSNHTSTHRHKAQQAIDGLKESRRELEKTVSDAKATKDNAEKKLSEQIRVSEKQEFLQGQLSTLEEEEGKLSAEMAELKVSATLGRVPETQCGVCSHIISILLRKSMSFFPT